MAYPTLKFDPPVFIGTGAADHDADPTAMQYPLVKAACATGSVIEHHVGWGAVTRSSGLNDSGVP
jgi:hypothetical protein